jgi:hypothetical protein
MLKIDEYLPCVNCIPRADMYILVQLWTLEQLSAHLIVRCDAVRYQFLYLLLIRLRGCHFMNIL